MRNLEAEAAKRRAKYRNDPEYKRRESARSAEAYRNDPNAKEKARVSAKLRRERYGRKFLLWRAKRKKARENGIEFTITLEDLAWPTLCPVLGVELDYGWERENRGPHGNYPTIDKRDNTVGYVPGNCFVVSHRANYLKSNATPDELDAVARYARFGPS